jgi:CDP-diglyceride synthetase
MDSQVETPVIPVDEPKKSRTGLIVGIVILVILCCCCGTIALFYFWLGDLIVDLFRSLIFQIGGLTKFIFV